MAAEGMFQLFALPSAGLERSKLKVPVSKIRALRKAIVQVGRGGSGSFVSKRGLVVTNHHVAYSCLARLGASKKHRGVLQHGHVANSLAEELPCPGYDLHVVERVEDVTQTLLAGLPEGTRRNYHGRFRKLRKKMVALRKACEAKKVSSQGQSYAVTCKVTADNHGASYTLTAYRRIRDVRLVYAPPKALGKFGGDIDNWMYPRHTADFTYLRAYVAKDGAGRPFAKANVPLNTPVFLEQGRWGIKRGSLVLVMGFPGRTARHVTSHGVRFHQDQRLSGMVALFEGAAKALRARVAESAEAKRKYATHDARLQNALKYYRMSAAGFARWKVLERTLRKEAALLAKLAPAQRKQAKRLLAEIGRAYRDYGKVSKRYAGLSRMTTIVPSVGAALTIARWSVERTRPEDKRLSSRYYDKNVYRLREGLDRLDRDIEPATEQAMLRYFLGQLLALPKGQRSRAVTKLVAWGKREQAKLRRQAKRKKTPFSAVFATSAGAAPAADELTRTVQLLYGKTALIARAAKGKAREAVKSTRAELWKAPRRALLAAAKRDPLLRFGVEMEIELRQLREGPLRLIEEYLGPVLGRRWITSFAKPAYPDANFTVRLSYGSVQDYKASATGKSHRYLTDLAGVIAKDKGRFPFEVPAWLKKAAKGEATNDAAKRAKRARRRFTDPQIKDVPVDFTTTLDTTGGNSGSAVLDDHGRLVGLLFDGTPESILSDWQYLPNEQRSICLDIRFAHYLATVQGATALLKELGLKK
ncbi:MAG: hypothetical protein CSA65_00140 [Proteobacteria bacterium]|nr:MAG: hypothetical protein CSA65_00140 [Pseudomonadota bacterium]